MISRVKRLENLLILNPPVNLREILEAGPPRYVLKEMARLHDLETKTIERAIAAGKRLGWPSDEEQYGAEAVRAYRQRIDLSRVKAARLAKEAETCEAPNAAASGPESKNVLARGPVQDAAATDPANEVTLWDYLPSGVTVDYASRLREKGMLGTEGHLAALQNSVECGYICAEAVVRMLRNGAPLTRQEAGDAARTAMRQLGLDNYRLHHCMEEVQGEARPPLGEDARYLCMKEVLCLIALSLNVTMDAMYQDDRLIIGPIADVEERVQQLVDAGQPTTRVIAGLTAQQRAEGGYVPASHWFFGYLRIRGPSRKRAAADAGPQPKRGQRRGQKRPATTMEAYLLKPPIDVT